MTDCPQCFQAGRKVSALTVVHHVLPDAAPAISDGWQLCRSGPECDVVYFRGESVLRLHDVRSIPFHKSVDSTRLVCFCFGHTATDLSEEVHRTGISTRQNAIRDACCRGEADCEQLNPQGHCCLGDVGKVIADSTSADSETSLLP